MKKNISLLLIPVFVALFALSYFLLIGGEEPPTPKGDSNTTTSVQDGFLSFILPANPDMDPQTRAKALRRLAEKYPLNNVLKAILDPAAARTRQVELYNMARKIHSGRADKKQIKEYYRIRSREITDRLELLAEARDRFKIEAHRERLLAARSSLNRMRDQQLKRAEQRPALKP